MFQGAPETARPAAAPATLTPSSPSTCLGSGQAAGAGRESTIAHVGWQAGQQWSANGQPLWLSRSYPSTCLGPLLATDVHMLHIFPPASEDTSASFWPSRPYVGRPKDSSEPAGAKMQKTNDGRQSMMHSCAFNIRRWSGRQLSTMPDHSSIVQAQPATSQVCPATAPTLLGEHQRVVLPAAHKRRILALELLHTGGCIHWHLACMRGSQKGAPSKCKRDCTQPRVLHMQQHQERRQGGSFGWEPASAAFARG